MASASGTTWTASQQSLSIPRVSETISERPIRPLPKRGIRSRLSDEQAERIVYPPVHPSSSPLFSPQFGHRDAIPDFSGYPPHMVLQAVNGYDQESYCDCNGDHGELDSGDEYDRRNGHSRSFWQGGVGQDRAVPHSAGSSGDGYDSFENTNNKKKRKIPVTGAHSLGSPEDPDVTNAGVTPQFDVPYSSDRSIVGHYYGSGAAATPIGGNGTFGPTRGRYNRVGRRSTGDRQPLATSTSALNSFPPHPAGYSRDQRKGNVPTNFPNSEVNSTPAAKGQENMSSPEHPNNPSNGFTFECKSNSSSKIGSFRADRQNHGDYQDPPAMPGSRAIEYRAGGANAAGAMQDTLGQPQPPPPPPEKKPKPRKPSREYHLAARQRRLQQEYNNFHHPPKKEDVWVCEFCEYESIFGVPPFALVRQYEEKDHKKRKEAEERRRLLEKAKAKGRKNKKGHKGPGKNTGAAIQDSVGNQQYDPQYDSMAGNDPDSPGDEYYDDGCYDDGMDPPTLPGSYDNLYNETYSPPPPPLPPGNHSSGNLLGRR